MFLRSENTFYLKLTSCLCAKVRERSIQKAPNRRGYFVKHFFYWSKRLRLKTFPLKFNWKAIEDYIKLKLLVRVWLFIQFAYIFCYFKKVGSFRRKCERKEKKQQKLAQHINPRQHFRPKEFKLNMETILHLFIGLTVFRY